VDEGLVPHPGPHVPGEGPKFLARFHEKIGVEDSGLDLGAVTHDAGVFHQPGPVPRPEAGYLLEIEAFESLTEILAFVEDRAPGKPGLEGFQDQEFEDAPIIMQGNAPFLVVVGQHERVVITGPRATLENLIFISRFFHGSVSVSHLKSVPALVSAMILALFFTVALPIPVPGIRIIP
jgi:hypothetical protein